MQHIGTRIRQLRKEKKLTLQQLAGERLTKGMLSLIENGKAQPSIDSLQYIAAQLQVDVSELMRNEQHEEAKKKLQQLEEAIEKYNYLQTEEEREQLRISAIASLKDYIEKANLDRYEEIEIYYYYAAFHTLDYSEEKERLLKDVQRRFENISAWSHALKCYFRIADMYFKERDYASAYTVIQEADQFMEAHDFSIDIMRKIDVYYYMIIFAVALGYQDVADMYMQKILKLSKETKLYYEVNELYRIQFVQALYTDVEKAHYYLKKMEQFALFTEDLTEQAFYESMHISYVLSIEKDYEKALDLVNHITQSDVAFYRDIIDMGLNGIRGIIYYHLQQFETALYYFNQHQMSVFSPHPLDICKSYYVFAMKGLTLLQLGQHEEGKKEVLYAYEQVKPYVSNYYKQQIEVIYNQLF